MNDDYNNLKLDSEGGYSLSHKSDADQLSLIIKEKYGDIKIMDATAGLGGNSISFGKIFTNVISIEIDENRCKLLQENLELYKVNNTVFCGNFMNFINMDYDLILIDPPWGGPNYKFEKSIKLTIDNKSLKEITIMLREKGKIVVFKLPFNYYINEFDKYNYQIYHIKNYLIVIIE